jgi:hypothetical protein
MSRDDRRDDIFLDDSIHQGVLATLAAACQKTGWHLHAYRRMRNTSTSWWRHPENLTASLHLHAVAARPNLVEGMS